VKERSSSTGGLLGLARRAGAVVPGLEAARTAVRNGEAHLLVFAGDASPEQLKKVAGLLKHRGVPVRWAVSRAELGRQIGRGSTSVIAVTTRSFAEQLMRRLPARPPEGVVLGEVGLSAEEDSGFDAGC
jgi:ribosomal protein L7Ae-like RNA K-turn-binding protein